MKQPWPARSATERIRKIAQHDNFNLAYTRHARERMAERGLLMGDVLYVLKNGFVYEDPESARPEGFYKYCMEAQTPNSGSRSVRVVVIPDEETKTCKIVTVMWVDES